MGKKYDFLAKGGMISKQNKHPWKKSIFYPENKLRMLKCRKPKFVRRFFYMNLGLGDSPYVMTVNNKKYTFKEVSGPFSQDLRSGE